MFKRVGKTTMSFTPSNTRCEQIWREVIYLHNIPTSPAPKVDVMGYELGIRYKFHMVKGNYT